MTQRTRDKIEENTNLLIVDVLGITRANDPEAVREALHGVIWNALVWTAEDVERQLTQNDSILETK